MLSLLAIVGVSLLVWVFASGTSWEPQIIIIAATNSTSAVDSRTFIASNSTDSAIEFWVTTEVADSGQWINVVPGEVLHYEDRKRMNPNTATIIRVEVPPIKFERWRIVLRCVRVQNNDDNTISKGRELLEGLGLTRVADLLSSETAIVSIKGPEQRRPSTPRYPSN